MTQKKDIITFNNKAKEIGILFKEELSIAAINGSKTRTSRVLPKRYQHCDKLIHVLRRMANDNFIPRQGLIGDYWYLKENINCKSKLFMKKKDARHWFQVEDFEIMRVSDLTDAMIKNEGPINILIKEDTYAMISSKKEMWRAAWNGINNKWKPIYKKDKDTGKRFLNSYVSFPYCKYDILPFKKKVDKNGLEIPFITYPNPWIINYEFKYIIKR